MSYDLSSLGILATPEEVAPDEYVAPSGTITLVAKGSYPTKLISGEFKTGRGDDREEIRIGKATCRNNGKDYFQVNYAVEITDGKDAGRRLYGRVNTIPFGLLFEKTKPGRENANGFMDLLFLSGFTGRLVSNDEYQNALLQLIIKGAIQKTSTDWSAYCNPKSKEYAGCGMSVRGMESFPPAEGGGYEFRVPCPSPAHEGQERPILLGNNDIKGHYQTTLKDIIS